MAKKAEHRRKDRKDYKILVTDVHAMGQIGVLRSLGRAGYQVLAISPKEDALGFHCSFATEFCVSPSYDEPGFVDWIQNFIKENRIDLIIPSEGFLWAIQSIFDQISSLLPLKRDPELIYNMINKFDYFRAISECDDLFVRANCPDILYVTPDNMPTEEDMAELDFPCFIKLDAAYGKAKSDGDGIVKVLNVEEAQRQIKLLSARYSSFIMQGYIAGQKAGVNLLMKEGEVQASYVMKASHETPHTGGVASLRQSWQQDEMLEDAIAKMRHLKWDGALMVEYRWNPKTNKFSLIEINLRFWGYLHLCLYAGVDFPRLLADDYLGLNKGEKPAIAKQVEARCLSFEVGYLLSLIKDPDVGLFRKIGALVNFVWNGLSWHIYSDGFFPGDRGLWFHEMTQTIRNLFRRPE